MSPEEARRAALSVARVSHPNAQIGDMELEEFRQPDAYLDRDVVLRHAIACATHGARADVMFVSIEPSRDLKRAGVLAHNELQLPVAIGPGAVPTLVFPTDPDEGGQIVFLLPTGAETWEGSPPDRIVMALEVLHMPIRWPFPVVIEGREAGRAD